MNKIHSLFLPLLFTTLAGTVAAQGDQTAEKEPSLYLKNKSGEVVAGKLRGLQGDKVRINTSVLGGSMTVTLDLDDFEPASVLSILRAANPPKDFDSHFAMARKAAELGLLTSAGKEARSALESVKGADDFEQKRATVRKWAADALEKMIADAIAAEDLPQARECLKLLTTRLADQRSEERLDAIAASVEGLDQAGKQKKDDARRAKLDAKVRASNEKKLEAIVKEVEKGDKDYRSAIRKSGSTTASKNLCEDAIAHFKKAYQDLGKLLGDNPDDGDLAAAAAPISRQIHSQGIAAALHAANMLCVRSDYKGAMDWAQRVIKFDPENQEAKEMVKTIIAAEADSSEVWGWTWPTVGRSRAQNQ